jgi:hypothetical protein
LLQSLFLLQRQLGPQARSIERHELTVRHGGLHVHLLDPGITLVDLCESDFFIQLVELLLVRRSVNCALIHERFNERLFAVSECAEMA